MGLFRNKNKLSNHNEGTRSTAGVEAAIGNKAVQRMTAETAEPAKTYAEEINERVVKLRQAEDEIVKESLNRGISEAELPTVIADAMNAGAHPRAIQGLTFRGSGVSLTLLDGHIPSEALAIHLVKSGETGQVYGATVMFSSAAKELKGEDFSYEDTGNLPQHSQPGDPINTDMLAKIDAHLPAIPQPEA